MPKSTASLIYVKYVIVAGAALLAIAGLASIGSTVHKTSASASGPSPSFTGAPVENNCTACHNTFPVNSGTGNVSISGLPANYLPGQTIPLTVTVTDSNAVIYGFQMVAINNTGQNVGAINLPNPSPQLQVISGFVNGNERRYVEHTNQGVTPTQFGSKSWNFTWTAPATRIGKLSFYAAGNGANSDGGSSNDQIYTTSKATLSGSAIANFDSDTKSDISVYRPSTGVWYALTSGEGGFQVTQFGVSGDKPAPGDYDGDGKTDNVVFRPSTGVWYLKNSTGTFLQVSFGLNGDIPVPGDYDGDAKNDIAVWRPSNNTWYILGSTGTYRVVQFGVSTDKPAQGDYDADGKTDIAVFRPSNGTWYMITSSNPAFLTFNFGVNGDLPVQGDYDGDGKTDIAVFRPSTGTWYTINATQGYYFTSFGVSGDKPSPADFDGDGKTDIAVFRNGTWYVLGSEGPSYSVVSFGQAGDIPVASGYIAE